MVEIHASARDQALDWEAATALRENRLDPKFLYVTARQTELWREIFRRHSPIHANPEFARIYRDAFTQVAERTTARRVRLIGLGCGTGLKERQLCQGLVAQGCAVDFSAIDVSLDLVAESSLLLVQAGAANRRSLVCDLAEADYLRGWLDNDGENLPCILTFFGLVPNMMPSVVRRLFHAVLRPGDILLVSAHLAPIENENHDELSAAMATVLPQYDNSETLAWLRAALEILELEDRVGPPCITVGEIEGMPAFLGQARWKNGERFEKWGEQFTPNPNEPLRLFYSLRHTPALFEKFVRDAGFLVERLALTACRQEGVWCVRSA